MDVDREGIERRLGGARPHRVRFDAVVVLEDCLVARVERADTIDLSERPTVSLEGLGLRPAARQVAPDGVEEPLLSAIGGGILGAVCLLLSARGCHVCFLFR